MRPTYTHAELLALDDQQLHAHVKASQQLANQAQRDAARYQRDAISAKREQKRRKRANRGGRQAPPASQMVGNPTAQPRHPELPKEGRP